MRIYLLIKKNFKFLETVYGLKISAREKLYTYYYVVWANSKMRICVMYDCGKARSMKIIVYDEEAPGTIVDGTEFFEELKTDAKSDRAKICYAAEWLENAIKNNVICMK